MLRIPRPTWAHRRHPECRPENNHLFFGNGSQAAKAICADCPVVQQCLDHAIDDFGLDGVWGGMTAPERDIERRRRQQVRQLRSN